MLKILRPPPFLDTANDVLSKKTEMVLQQCGIDCSIENLWPEKWARLLLTSTVPFKNKIFKWGPAYCTIQQHLKKIQTNGTYWIRGPSLPEDTSCYFCRKILEKKGTYIFSLLDDWFSIPFLKPVAEVRIALAHLVLVPTLSLKNRVQELFPNTAIEVFEEPVDIHRLHPLPKNSVQKPVLVWSGGTTNIHYLQSILDVLKTVHQEIPFMLRIITGYKRPKLHFPFEWEWFPYQFDHEANLLRGAVAGLAPLTNTSYNHCKGTYKIKTYMACGIPPFAPSIGDAPRLIRSHENGFLVDTKESWIETLLLLLKKLELQTKIAEKARQTAVSIFSHEKVIPQWAHLLTKRFPNLLQPSLSPHGSSS